MTHADREVRPDRQILGHVTDTVGRIAEDRRDEPRPRRLDDG
jgi:hypothetical protein